MAVKVSLNNPSVSIGMPVYNGDKFITYALDSLLAQEFTDFELIISDNASTDATESICRNYAERDVRIKYIRQSQNEGAWKNFQFVLGAAKGEYFMWAACDDTWHESWINMLLKILIKTKKKAVFGKLIHIDEFSKPVSHPATKNSFNFSGSIFKRKITFFLEYEGNGKANLIHSLFRREDLKTNNLLTYSLDYYLLFDLLNVLEFISVSDVFLYKRIHSASAAASKPKSVTLKLLYVLTLKTIINSYRNAKGYLKYSKGLEKLMLIVLIPIKILVDHIFYMKRVLIKLFNLSF